MSQHVTRLDLPALSGSVSHPKSVLFFSSVLLGAAALLVAEVLVRLFCLPLAPFRDAILLVSDPRGYVPRPNASVTFRGMSQALPEPVEWSFNSEGIRAPGRIPGTKRPGALRIATYGDSEAFGWAVNFVDTFQVQMERLEPRLDVLNFGVPGYNVVNVAEHAARTAHSYQPDLLFYLVHPNDVDPPLQIHAVTINSELLRRLHVFIRVFQERESAQQRRRPERIRAMADQLARMKALCEENRIEFVIGFIDRQNTSVLKADPRLDDYFLRGPGSVRRVVDVSEIFRQDQLKDGHLSRDGHRKLAALLTDRLGRDPVTGRAGR